MSRIGGAGGTRTPYLMLAKHALSQMSYSPTEGNKKGRVIAETCPLRRFRKSALTAG